MFSLFSRPRSTIAITNLNEQYLRTINDVRFLMGNKGKELGREHYQRKLFVINFNGDIMASQAKGLSQEVTAILCTVKPGDKVLVKVTSPGGAAHAYGYAASQLERLKKAKIPVIVAVDQVAASGGYMMACVSDWIISSPYAIIGSIGVVAEFPNVFNLLKEIGIDYKQYTAGKFKRTVSTMGKITEEGEKKFQEDLLEMYDLFRNHVHTQRPELDMDRVATGEHWHGITAKEIGLVDEIKTSEEYILEHIGNSEVIQLEYIGDKKSWAEKLGGSLAQSFAAGFVKAFFNQLMEMAFTSKTLQ